MVINITRAKAFQKHSFLNYSSAGLFSAPALVLEVPLQWLWLMAALALPVSHPKAQKGLFPPHPTSQPHPPALKGCYSRKAQLDERG